MCWDGFPGVVACANFQDRSSTVTHRLRHVYRDIMLKDRDRLFPFYYEDAIPLNEFLCALPGTAV